jgi:succinyl-diaminopimelate desuccinylase
MFKEYLNNNKDNIINTICDLVKIPSVSDENSRDEFPFGKNCNDVLMYTLELGKSLGFRTKNIDGYCGYIEFGEGDELVGIIGHLDVVPALKEDGWNTEPFEPTIIGNKIFGRGTIDDKGPVVASLYAMKAVMENAKVSKRVRLILGLNEEKNWKCINYYKQVEEAPLIGFSPDANFPAIYAEKGILSLEISNPFSFNNFEIVEINCNDNAINVVPKYCSITLKKKKINLNFKSSESSNSKDALTNLKWKENKNIEIQELDNDTVKIIAKGIASHAAHPDLGKNAITILLKYLVENLGDIEPAMEYIQKLFHLGFFEIESPEFLSRKDIAYATEFEDNSCIQDESGSLTSNVGYIDYKNKKLSIKLNLRVPVHTSLDDIVLKYKQLVRFYNDIKVLEISRQEPLCVSKDSDLVKSLVTIFNEETGLNEEAVAIGGGTYARAFPNFISYGANMPGDVDMCHQANEFIDIDKLMTSSYIYANAIYKLAK